LDPDFLPDFFLPLPLLDFFLDPFLPFLAKARARRSRTRRARAAMMRSLAMGTSVVVGCRALAAAA
jgi:hypothetical protein